MCFSLQNSTLHKRDIVSTEIVSTPTESNELYENEKHLITICKIGICSKYTPKEYLDNNFQAFPSLGFVAIVTVKLRQHRTIWQEAPAWIFGSIQSLENEGILYVFLVFQTEEVGHKDGCGSQTQLRGVAL